jgi:predicted dehydrogenase
MMQPSFGRLTQLLCSFCSGKYDARRCAGYEDPLQAFLLDFSVHHLDLARYLGGEVARLAFFHQELADASAYAVALEFENGAVGTLQLNSQRIWWRNYDRIELTGQGEYLVLDGLWSIRHYGPSENTFTENYSDERSGELTGDGLALIEFVEAIRTNRQPIASIHDCVETMKLYQAIYDAVRAGRDGTISIER